MILIYIIREIQSFLFAHKDRKVLLVMCLVQMLLDELNQNHPLDCLNIFRFDKYRLYIYVIINCMTNYIGFIASIFA